MERYLSQQQSDALYSLKDALSSYSEETYDGSVMRDVLDSVVYRYEDRGFRTFDVNELQKRKKELQELGEDLRTQIHTLSTIENYDAIDDIESKLSRIRKQLESLDGLIANDGKEMLLGTYHYDAQSGNGVIILFLDNINDASKVLPKRFGSNASVYLLQYVFVHEAFHSYFDMCHNDKIQEIEEAMAEYASLCFLSGYDKNVFSLAEYEINEKKNSPIWTSAYGFGTYLFNTHLEHGDLIDLYVQNSHLITIFTKTVIEFIDGFDSGYPWSMEEHYYRLLKVIVSGKVLCDCGNVSDSKDICTSCGRLLKPSGIYYCDRNNHWNKWRQGVVDGTCLQEVDLSDMGISRLELHDVIIKSLKCSHNKLKTLDLSDVKGLVEVDCSCNDILSLNIDGCNTLENLTCYDNDMYILDLTHAPSLKKLDCSYCYNLTALNVDKNVHLIELCCDGGSNFMEIKALDLSRNLELEILRCNFGILEYLDLTNNLNLKILDCSSNLLNHLDLHSNNDLRELNCEFNENLSELNVTGNLLMETLYCNSCNLKTLNLHSNVALTSLDCSDNSLSSLDLRANSALTNLNCYGNSLAALDLSENVSLTSLDCSNNSLSSLDLRANSALTNLNCSGNSLAALDLSENVSLTSLDCSNNSLASLDLEMNVNLTKLNCCNLPISSLNLENNFALEELTCVSCRMKSVDLSNCPKMRKLVISMKSIGYLDLSNNLNLEKLSCDSCSLKILDLSHNTMLQELYCQNNKLKILDLRHNGELKVLNCCRNLLEELDLRMNTVLKQIDCSRNRLNIFKDKDRKISQMSSLKLYADFYKNGGYVCYINNTR